MVSDLMPLENEAPRCSEFARSLGVRPLGSGLRLDRVVLVSLPKPWPKPALAHPLLKPSVAAATASGVASRLFASEPGRSHPSSIEVFERDGLMTTHHRWNLHSNAVIPRLVEEISTAPLTALDDVVVDGVERADSTEVTTPTFLVCTQGSHDGCCGTFGEALAEAISLTRPRYDVRRVSHTGGHRFAPTLLALPSGRMWGFADIELVDRIAEGNETSADLLERCRGWWGAGSGAAQVAECAVRSKLNSDFAVAPTIEVSAVTSKAARTICVVQSGSMRWEVEVEVVREVPTIACETLGGVPAKAGREFAGTVNPIEGGAS